MISYNVYPIDILSERTMDQPFERHGTSIRKRPTSMTTLLGA